MSRLWFWFFLVLALVLLWGAFAWPHDASRPDLDSWFKGLSSGLGPCCSGAEAKVLMDSDWESKDGHYRVFIDSQWRDVPDNAVVDGPNLDGRSLVWPYYGMNGSMTIRCFMKGLEG